MLGQLLDPLLHLLLLVTLLSVLVLRVGPHPRHVVQAILVRLLLPVHGIQFLHVPGRPLRRLLLQSVVLNDLNKTMSKTQNTFTLVYLFVLQVYISALTLRLPSDLTLVLFLSLLHLPQFVFQLLDVVHVCLVSLPRLFQGFYSAI
jgi:hypothetical protein